MARTKDEDVALVGIGKLEALAKGYEQTARGLKKLAKSLRRVMDGVGGQASAAEPQAGPPKRRKGPSTKAVGRPKSQGMPPSQRKALSEAMKKRWAERKAKANGSGHKKAAQQREEEELGAA